MCRDKNLHFYHYTQFFHAASCFREGFSECGDCEEGENCQVGSCSCHSDCYEYGNCCPDVPYMQNCTGEGLKLNSLTLKSFFNQMTSVKVVLFVLLEDQTTLLGFWRCVPMECGVRFATVTSAGDQLIPKLFVSNLDILLVVRYCMPFVSLSNFIFVC